MNKTLNILTNREETLRAMEEIEGSGWVDYCNEADGEYTVNGILALHASRTEEDICMDDDDGDNYMHGSVYGSGGWNRWFIRFDGRLVLSGGHATRQALLLAKVLGFEIHNEYAYLRNVLSWELAFTKATHEIGKELDGMTVNDLADLLIGYFDDRQSGKISDGEDFSEGFRWSDFRRLVERKLEKKLSRQRFESEALNA